MDLLHTFIVPPGARGSEAEYIALALVALLLAAVSKGGFGGIAGGLSVPLMFQVAPPLFVIGLWLPVLVVCDLCTIRQFRREWHPPALRYLLPGMLLGILCTTLALRGAPSASAAGLRSLEAWLKLSVALTAAVFLVLQLWPRRAPAADAPPWKPGWSAHLPVGLIGGVTTTIAHAAGPIVNIYLLPQKLSPAVQTGTLGRLFALVNSAKIPFMVAIGVVSWQTVQYGLWLMLLAPLGVALGAHLNRRSTPRTFLAIIHASLLIAALKLGTDAWQVLRA
jgi:uncharacterized membrane protein YfcA